MTLQTVYKTMKCIKKCQYQYVSQISMTFMSKSNHSIVRIPHVVVLISLDASSVSS